VVSKDLLDDLDDDDPIYQLVLLAAPWFEELKDMDPQEDLIDLNEENLFSSKTAHSLDEIINNLNNVGFGEFLVSFIK